MKKGFTLIELLAVIAVLAIILLIAVPNIINIINDVKNNTYAKNEKMVTKAAQAYFTNNILLLPGAIGSTVEISISTLETNKYISTIKDPKSSNNCGGYIIVTKLSEGSYDYATHLKCGNESAITDSTTDGLVTNYKFEDFEEPTVNLLSGQNINVDTGYTTISGSDSIGKYYIKPTGYLYGWEGIRIPNTAVVSGKKYTLSIDLLSDYEYSIAWDANVTGGGYSGNDAGRDYLLISPANYVNTGNWQRMSLIAGVRSDLTSPVAGDSICSTSPAILDKKVYYKNAQLEIKDYPTPYTATSRTGIVKDNSGKGNNATLALATTPRWVDDIKKGMGAYYFDGIVDSISSDNNMSLTGSQTYLAWIYVTSTSTWLEGILTPHDFTTTSNIGMNLSTGKLSASIGYTDGSREFEDKQSVQAVPLNKWTQVALVYNQPNNTVSFYIDGVLDSIHSVTKTVKFTNSKLLIGQWSNNHNGFFMYKGNIDNISVYSKALTDNEILNDYLIYK